MSQIVIPEGYKPLLNLKETQIAIKQVKDFFQRELAAELNLKRVSAPLFVSPESGLNDNLNGVERPVSFGIKEQDDKPFEIVHSLAKWKRLALKRYNFNVGEGLYTDMNAIRRDEETDNIHSIFVDLWDWEKIIPADARNEKTLRDTVKAVYEALRVTEKYVANKYDYVECFLPEEITFITTQELVDLYPDMSAKEREYEIVKKHGAVYSRILSGSRHRPGTLLHGYPRQRRSAGRAVKESRLRRTRRASIPERSSGRQTAADHRRRNRPVPNLYVLPPESAYRRDSGLRMSG